MNFVNQNGNMLSSTKAEILDRYENRAFLYIKLNMKRKHQAQLERIQIIKNAKTHSELSTTMYSFETETILEFNENKAISLVLNLVRTLFEMSIYPDGTVETREIAVKMKDLWCQLKEIDSEICWDIIRSYPPYRNRMIFTDAQLDLLGNILIKHGYGC
jgi:hypothetical protein